MMGRDKFWGMYYTYTQGSQTRRTSGVFQRDIYDFL